MRSDFLLLGVKWCRELVSASSIVILVFMALCATIPILSDADEAAERTKP